jgi:formylglycine-generating enzyme required for sulfatase activity
MPRPEELPPSLDQLTRRQALRLTHEEFRSQTRHLIEEIAQQLSGRTSPDPPSPSRRTTGHRLWTNYTARITVIGGILSVMMAAWFLLKSLPPPQTFTNSIGMAFVRIPVGEYTRGSIDGPDDEQPVHTIRISQPFYLGKYEVTQAQWEAVMGNNPSHFTGNQNRPVGNVSWNDVQEFIRALNTKEHGIKHRLPTEAEWEYAARAGTKTAYSFGDNASELDKYGWYNDNSKSETHPVGQLKPNAWGLYDMHGNVWEWVQDRYTPYISSSTQDPQGPSLGFDRVFRGGEWGSDAVYCRSANRGKAPASFRDRALGFHLLQTAP